MSYLNKKFKEEFNKIDFSLEVENNIKQNIVTKYKRYKKNRNIFLSVITVLIISLISFGFIYADDIKETFNTLVIRIGIRNFEGKEYNAFIIDSSSIKELNYEANLKDPKCVGVIDHTYGIDEKEGCYSLYTYEEIEKILGIKLLKSDLFKQDKLILRDVKRIDGKIAYIKLGMVNLFQIFPNKKNIYIIPVGESLITYSEMNIILRTKYNETNEEPLMWTNDLSTIQNLHKHSLKKLNITALSTRFFNRSRFIFFDYDNVSYSFRIRISGNKNLDVDEEIQKILDSLRY